MALLDIALWISFALMMAPTGLAVVKGPVEMVGALVPGIPSADLATPFADHVLHIDMVRARGQRAAVSSRSRPVAAGAGGGGTGRCARRAAGRWP